MVELLRQKKAHELFKRYKGNPIMTSEHWPYPANAVFNPAAAKLNNETLLLIRVEDMRGFSHLTVARSVDGFTNWDIDPTPTMLADQNSREEKWGIEDARIVWLEEQKQFAVTYVSFSEGGPVVSLAITKNFRTFARLGGLLPPEDKDACLFPRRFNGRFALIHRPIVLGEAHIWLSLSPDLTHWGDHRILLTTRTAYWKTALTQRYSTSKSSWQSCSSHRNGANPSFISFLRCNGTGVADAWGVTNENQRMLPEPAAG